MADALAGTVVAVSSDPAHRFSKLLRPHIRLIEDFGIEGDAHAGRLVKHRYDARRTPNRPNLRQIHLIQYELFSELEALGFVVPPHSFYVFLACVLVAYFLAVQTMKGWYMRRYGYE